MAYNFKPKLKMLAALILGLAFMGQFQNIAYAQSKDLMHQNGASDTNHVHAVGTSNNPGAFTETYAPPKIISTYGKNIDWLFRYTSWVTFAFFVVMTSALVFFIFAYRERPGHKAFYTHGTSSGNTMTTRILDMAVFVSLDIVLIVASFIFTNRYLWIDMPSGKDVVRLEIMPQQWMWNFRYAGKDGQFGSADDIASNHVLRIPVNRPIVVQLKSKDVIHGFMIPNVKMQMDAIPGVITKFWFDAKEVGEYELACMHLCGAAHYKMKGIVKVMPSDEYDAWEKENTEWSAASYDPNDKQLQWAWTWVDDPPKEGGFLYKFFYNIGERFL